MNTPCPQPNNEPTVGGVILCGGQSNRMGVPKAELPFGDFTMLETILNVVGQVTDRCVVVGEVPDQLRESISQRFVRSFGHPLRWASDHHPSCGPMEGLRIGLGALASSTAAAFVTSCDAPLLKPALIEFLFSQTGSFDAAIPYSDEQVFGLTAVYKTSLEPEIERRVLGRQLQISSLFELPNVKQIDLEELAPFDPEFESFFNINRPKDYLDLLKRQGHDCPDSVRSQLGQN